MTLKMSNDAENSFLHHRYNLHVKIYLNRKHFLNYFNIPQHCCSSAEI